MGRRHIGMGLAVGIFLLLTDHPFAQVIGIVADGAHVEIRTAPPHGPFNLFRGDRADENGVVEPGSCIVILSERTFNGFQGVHVWYEIGPVDAESEVSQGWWLYAGVKNAAGQTPVVRVTETPSGGGDHCSEGGS